jgi:hypothetical protein
MVQFLKDKFLSRKFATAIAAVVAAFAGLITWPDALNVVMLWLAVQGTSDIVSQIKSNKESK